MKSKEKKKNEILLVIIVLILLLFVIIKHFSVEIGMLSKSSVSKEMLSTQLRSHGSLTGILLLVAVIILCVIPGFPIAVAAVFTGVVFGPIIGSIINISGIVIGNLLTIQLMNYLSFEKVKELSKKLQQKVLKQKHTDLMLSLCYMIPIVPTFAVNYVMNQLKFSLIKQVKIIFLGIIPVSILYAFGGNTLLKGDIKIIAIMIVVIVFLVIMVKLLKKRILS